MGTKRKAREPETEEFKAKDFARAVKLYKDDIKPARSKAAEHMQEASTAFKAVKKGCNIQPSSVKAAISNVVEAEDAKADDWLRGFCGFVNEAMGRTVLTFHGTDLVDIAEGKTPNPTARPRLVTVPLSDGVDADLADEDFESPEPRNPPAED